MGQTATRLQLPRHTFWRVALAAFTTPPRLMLLCACLVTLAVSVSGIVAQVTSYVLLGGGTVAVVVLAFRFIALTRHIRKRLTHQHAADFGELLFFDGAEECVASHEVEGYSCILSWLERDLGMPISRRTVCIYLLPEGLPFGVTSSLFRCSFVRCLISPEDDQLPSDGVLQQAVALYLYTQRHAFYRRFRRLLNRMDCYRLGQAIIWGAFPQRYAHRYSIVASYRSIGVDTRAIHLARGLSSDTDLASTILLAFVAEQKGLRNMFESYTKARTHERISLSYMVGIFGGAVQLEQRWSQRLNLARSLDPDPEVRDVISLANQLAQAGFPNEALQELKKLLVHHPHSVPLLASAAKHAAQLHDAHECLALIAMLKLLVQSACSRARLQLAQGLLHRITGDMSKAQACFQQVLEAESPVTHVHTLADRWVTKLPSNDWAWIEVQRMLGVML